MSRLLEKACQEAKSGIKDLINQVRHIGNKFLNAVEINAKEAVLFDTSNAITTFVKTISIC